MSPRGSPRGQTLRALLLRGTSVPRWNGTSRLRCLRQQGRLRPRSRGRPGAPARPTALVAAGAEPEDQKFSGPEMGRRKRVTRKAGGKLTRLVNLGGSWHEKLTLLVTCFSLRILAYPFQGHWECMLHQPTYGQRGLHRFSPASLSAVLCFFQLALAGFHRGPPISFSPPASQRSEGGMIWLETFLELKLLNSSFRACPLIESRQTAPRRAIRGNSI